jgi:hypothetical protein
MTIKRKSLEQTLVIDLDGPDGNAFCLLAAARQLAKQAGLNDRKIQMEMTSGDYVHLVKTFDRYFGSNVVLETNNPMLADALGKSFLTED